MSTNNYEAAIGQLNGLREQLLKHMTLVTNDGSDAEVLWTSMAMHDHLHSLVCKTMHMQYQLELLNENPKLIWAIQLIERGVTLMPAQQLNEWHGVWTFLHSFKNNHDQNETNQTTEARNG